MLPVWIQCRLLYGSNSNHSLRVGAMPIVVLMSMFFVCLLFVLETWNMRDRDIEFLASILIWCGGNCTRHGEICFFFVFVDMVYTSRSPLELGLIE